MNFISGTILQFYHSQNFTTVKIIRNYVILCEFLRWLRSKDPLARPGAAGNAGSIPGSGRTLREGNGNLLQYSCLGRVMDSGAWQATVHGVAKSQRH